VEHRAFKKILADLVNELTAAQVETLNEELAARGSPGTVCGLVEQHFEKDKKCPHCGGNQLRRWGRASGLQRFMCSVCNKTFNALTGKPLARLRHKERWLGYLLSLADSLSVRRSAAKADISTNTAFRWRHRFLEAQKHAKDQQLTGICEVDETFFLESFKGLRSLPRPARKRGGKAKKRGLSNEQVPVLIARDRHANHIDAALPDRSKKAVSNVLAGKMARDIILCTDSDPAIIAFARDEGLKCETLIASKGEHGRGPIHVQNVNGYISRLKKWMARFNGVATKYLASYLGWRRMLDLRTTPLTSKNCLISVLC
jgi:transposase-like protein